MVGRSSLLIAFLSVAAGMLSTDAAAMSLEVEGTEFKLTSDQGMVMRSRELIGAVLTINTGNGSLKLRIDAVERDPEANRGDIWLHSLSTQAADGSWRNLCDAGPDGRRQAFPLALRPRRSDGLMEPAPPSVFELTCTAGARGKCVRFGYLPWDGQIDLYNACVRMVRADYCGDGEGTTRDGMPIDLYDELGTQSPENDPGQQFEAGWTPAGAVCVAHVRVKENTSLKALRRTCPRLSDRLGEGCTEASARAAGAILFNRSNP